MTPREERGLVIAATKNIVRNGKDWIVPSQFGKQKYTVRPDKNYCSCPDHDALGIKCKHIFAVEFVQQRELFPDGSATVTQTVTVKETVRKTYAQDWPAYNAAQCCEKEKFLHLLRDLCDGVDEPPQPKGRKRVPLRDALFCIVYKVYSGFSSRRLCSDLRDACDTRSNVESVFSAVKRKFGDSVRSKTEVAAKNEVLAKLLAHNLTVLIMEMHTLGIEPERWDGDAAPAILQMVRPA